MRTTLAIDDDVLAAVKHLAQRQQKSLGEVISSLARSGLKPSASRASPALRNGIPLLTKRAGGKAVTLDLVNQLRDEGP